MALIGIRFCPKCGSEDVQPIVGGLLGTWICKKCGFTGIFPEKTPIIKGLDNNKVLDDLVKDKEEINKKAKKKK